MKKNRNPKSFITKPVYPGGLKAMRAFIKENLKYPEDARKNKIHGSVYCKYQVNYQGKVVKTRIISGIGYGCDEEAIRLINQFKFHYTKPPRKIKVTYHKSIRINFSLPKEKSKSEKQSLKINYSVKEKSKNSYNYTINI